MNSVFLKYHHFNEYGIVTISQLLFVHILWLLDHETNLQVFSRELTLQRETNVVYIYEQFFI